MIEDLLQLVRQFVGDTKHHVGVFQSVTCIAYMLDYDLWGTVSQRHSDCAIVTDPDSGKSYLDGDCSVVGCGQKQILLDQAIPLNGDVSTEFGSDEDTFTLSDGTGLLMEDAITADNGVKEGENIGMLNYLAIPVKFGAEYFTWIVALREKVNRGYDILPYIQVVDIETLGNWKVKYRILEHHLIFGVMLQDGSKTIPDFLLNGGEWVLIRVVI